MALDRYYDAREVDRHADAFQVLTAARQADVGDAAALVYLTALREFSADVVECAVAEFQQDESPSYGRLPELGVVLARCREVRHRQVAAPALPALRDDADRTYHCPLCEDEPNGWRPFVCPDVSCGRTREHPAHHYVGRCRCWFFRHGETIRLKRGEYEQKRKRPSVAMLEVEAFDAGRYPWATAEVQVAKPRRPAISPEEWEAIRAEVQERIDAAMAAPMATSRDEP